MKLHIQHTTSYKYEKDVAHSTQYLRLTPSSSSRQKIISWDLQLPAVPSRSIDAYGNILHVVTVDFPIRRLLLKRRAMLMLMTALVNKLTSSRHWFFAINTTHQSGCGLN